MIHIKTFLKMIDHKEFSVIFFFFFLGKKVLFFYCFSNDFINFLPSFVLNLLSKLIKFSEPSAPNQFLNTLWESSRMHMQNEHESNFNISLQYLNTKRKSMNESNTNRMEILKLMFLIYEYFTSRKITRIKGALFKGKAC